MSSELDCSLARWGCCNAKCPKRPERDFDSFTKFDQSDISGDKRTFVTGDKQTKAEVVTQYALTGLTLIIGEANICSGPSPSNGPSGFGDLTIHEVNSIQETVDQAGRPLEVGGSAASGTRRGVGTDLPIGKGPGTKSDIDYFSNPQYLPYFMDIQHLLPGIDPATGIVPGNINPYQGPGIRFELGVSPQNIPKQQ